MSTHAKAALRADENQRHRDGDTGNHPNSAHAIKRSLATLRHLHKSYNHHYDRHITSTGSSMIFRHIKPHRIGARLTTRMEAAMLKHRDETHLDVVSSRTHGKASQVELALIMEELLVNQKTGAPRLKRAAGRDQSCVALEAVQQQSEQ
ncbi:hypothetical protein [Paraburkholderia terrae]|uniref:hypothetical protein n=2 Tax=Paraburkholderia terrae TaxID=311230 RepID=UPI003365AEE2